MFMYKVAALYKFTEVIDSLSFHNEIRKKLKEFSIYGTILVGDEGINGTISSSNNENLLKALNYIKSYKEFDDLDIKYSSSDKNPFVRLKVKLKEEIVTIGDKSIDPTKSAGEYVEPENWNDLIDDKNTIIIDTRNNYEYSIGTFKNSINPNTTKFREFPNWLKKNKFTAHEKNNKNIAMFCTGGIRCEKSTSYLKSIGFEEVYHLEGGILKYLEKIPKKESRWNGSCFVFDYRVSVDHNLELGHYEMCFACRMPISQNDKMHKYFVQGESCHHCFKSSNNKQKKSSENSALFCTVIM